MTRLRVDEQIAALQSLIFGAIESWNAAHPHRLRSHRERGSLNVTHVYGDTGGVASYLISIDCTLAGHATLKFHGTDLATVAEHARLTLEHNIEVELRRRADQADYDAALRRHGIAV